MSDKKVKKTVNRGSNQVVELEQHLGELTQDLQRVQADFINYKRRSEEEMNQRLKFGQQLAVGALLPTLDNLERAMANIPDDLKENSWADGVAKSAKQLLDDLEKLGLKKIETVGKPFDPQYMDAVMVEGVGTEEIVSEELQPGYMLGDEILRHATVKVERK